MSHQFLKHALVQCALGFSTRCIFLCFGEPLLRNVRFSSIYVSDTDLVVHFQAVPMRLELLQTVFAHLADTTEVNGGWVKEPIRQVCRRKIRGESVQVSGASRYPSTLLQTVSRVSILRLAEHKVL